MEEPRVTYFDHGNDAGRSTTLSAFNHYHEDLPALVAGWWAALNPGAGKVAWYQDPDERHCFVGPHDPQLEGQDALSFLQRAIPLPEISRAAKDLGLMKGKTLPSRKDLLDPDEKDWPLYRVDVRTEEAVYPYAWVEVRARDADHAQEIVMMLDAGDPILADIEKQLEESAEHQLEEALASGFVVDDTPTLAERH